MIRDLHEKRRLDCFCLDGCLPTQVGTLEGPIVSHESNGFGNTPIGISGLLEPSMEVCSGKARLKRLVINYAMILRRKVRFSYLALLGLLSWSSLNAQPATTPPRFRTTAQMVLVPVTVTDYNGKTISGLRPQDFTILDDERPQQILSFSSEDAPCSVGLVLDISGSMRNMLKTAQGVAHAFLSTANPDDDFLLLTVSTQPEAISEFTTDIATLEESIGLTRPSGMTALIDTVYLGLSRMHVARRPRRAVLILSDGMDNQSRYTKGELLRAALETDVQIYTIVFHGIASMTSNTVPFHVPFHPIKKPFQQGEERQGRLLLEELSSKTGGLRFGARTDAEAKEAVIKIGQALRNEYVIGYRPAASAIAGKWHRVRVRLNVPKVSVNARSGYYSR